MYASLLGELLGQCVKSILTHQLLHSHEVNVFCDLGNGFEVLRWAHTQVLEIPSGNFGIYMSGGERKGAEAQ